jgi:hypothetical protein
MNRPSNESACLSLQVTVNSTYCSKLRRYIWTELSRNHLLISHKFISYTLLIMISERKPKEFLLKIQCSSFVGLPCVFALMLNKKGVTYPKIFFQLKQIVSERQKQFSPKLNVTDYESSVLPVVKNEASSSFPDKSMFDFQIHLFI